MAEENEKPESKIFYNLEEAWNDTKSDFSFGSNKDKAASAAKLVGKTIFNTGVYAGKLGFRIIKELPQQLEQQQIAREEKREKYEQKSDSELKRIIKSDGFFGASLDEKAIAKSILRERDTD